MKKNVFVIVAFLLLNCIQLYSQSIKIVIDTLKHKKEIKISQTDKYLIRGTSYDFVNIQERSVINNYGLKHINPVRNYGIFLFI